MGTKLVHSFVHVCIKSSGSQEGMAWNEHLSQSVILVFYIILSLNFFRADCIKRVLRVFELWELYIHMLMQESHVHWSRVLLRHLNLYSSQAQVRIYLLICVYIQSNKYVHSRLTLLPAQLWARALAEAEAKAMATATVSLAWHVYENVWLYEVTTRIANASSFVLIKKPKQTAVIKQIHLLQVY